MSAPEFPKGIAPSTLKNCLKPLSLWAASPTAEADLESIFGRRLNWASAFRHLAAFQRADFSLLPPIRTLPSTDMPGLWGGYSRDTREIFLSAECPEESLSAVLIEEIGHFLDQELCLEETPGEEGALFAATVLGLPISNSQREAFSSDNDLLEVSRNGQPLLVEGAKSSGGKKSGSGRRSGGRRRGGRSKSVFSNSEVSASGGGGGGGGGTPSASPSNVPPSSGSPSLGGGSVVLPPSQDGNLRIEQKSVGDTLVGSTGNDTYVIFDQNVTIADSYGGTDLVESKVTFSLAKLSPIEHLSLTGASNIDGTGNSRANIITGNSGNNKLDGGLDSSIDTLQGGAGNDTYALRDTLDQIVEAVGGGSDTIVTTQATFSMANYANVENLAYSGTGTGVTFTGNSGNNLLTGTAGADSLDGGDGIDTLVGGLGNDTYGVNSNDDLVLEASGQGVDLVLSTAPHYALNSNVENLTLDGPDSISGTGNALDNILVGNVNHNSLLGLSGNDSIFGSGGDDTALAGEGDDLIFGDASKFIEDSAGEDIAVTPYDPKNTATDALAMVQTALNTSSKISITSAKFTGKSAAAGLLADGVNFGTIRGEKIEMGPGFLLTTGLADTKGKTAEDNGSTANNTAGSYLVNDILKDVFDPSVTSNDAATLEFKFTVSDPNASWISMQILFGSEEYPEFVNSYPDIAGVFIDGVNAALFDGDISSPLSVLGKNVDNGYFLDNSTGEYSTIYDGITRSLTLGGRLGVGVNGEHTIRIVIADTNDRILDSGIFVSDIQAVNSATFGLTLNEPTGNDSLLGGSGNDTIFGNGGNDTLLGEEGDDRLDGGAGADSMLGGTGNDIYIVDSAFDAVVESLGEGSDTVESGISYTLTSGSHIEVLNLTGSSSLSGTGNEFDNTILGNIGTNMLSGGAGNDSLAGGGGRDTLLGGSGDDTLFAIYESDLSSSLAGGTGNDLYLVDSTLNSLNDISGNDTVEASVSYNLAARNVIGVENLVLLGTDNLIGIGNSLANSLIGNSGDNSLLGGLGRDTLLGGEGNDTLDARKDQGDTAPDRLEGGSGDDTYLVNSTLDTVVGTGSNETIVSTVSFSLASSLVSGVGNLLLSGTGDIDGTGDSLANRVTGNSGINVLRGGAGDDTLLGGGGNDQFIGGEGLDLLVGGTGNDLFVAENASDAASDVFLGGGGIDSVRSAVSFDLGASNVSDIDNLIYNGSAGATLTGNISDNSLISQGAGNDTLIAVGGNNTLDGGQGDNFLIGGSGNDYFIVNTTGDTVIEADSDGGIDEVAVRISVPSGQLVAYQLEDDQNVEILSYEGNRQSSLVGNNLNNAIYGAQFGNTLDGADGDDYLVGGSGRDSLHGGGGDDTLDGRGGSDTLSGGEGSDYYYVDSQTANIIETNNPAPTTPRSHADAIRSSVSYSLVYNLELASKIEDLHLSGSANLQGTGNSLDNYITGNDGENTLTGQGGNDTVYGGLGADLVEGGVGNDLLFGGGTPQTDLPEDASTSVAVNPGQTYSGTFDRVGNANLINNSDVDWIRTELNAGQAYTFEFSASFVGSALELSLTSFGIDYPRTATGGIDGVWDIYDESGSYFYYNNPAREARNKKFFLKIELLRDSTVYIPVYSYGPAVGTYTLTLPQGGEPALTFGDNASNTLLGGDGSDTLVAGNGRDAKGNPIGDILLGGTNGIPGSIDTDNSSDSLLGGDGNDILDGGQGADTMVGGAGNDTYFVENKSDGIVETEDGGRHDLVIASLEKNPALWVTDLGTKFAGLNPTTGAGFDLDLANVYSSVEHASLMGSANLYILGNSDSNSLSGNFGNNYINAGRGDDSLFGQGGNDYLVGGDGADLLDGGSGINTMGGGFGADTYVVNDRNDWIIDEEQGLDGGEDLVRTYFNFDPIQGLNQNGDNTFAPNLADFSPAITKSPSFASTDLASFYALEHFELLGAAVYGVGNALSNSMKAGNSPALLLGNGGEDTLLGGVGGDTLFGDTPDFYATPDLYASAPKDTQTQEFLDGIIGQEASDYLDGGAGDNYLDGGRGFDTMIGGAGNDTFVQDNVDDYIVAGGGANELISSVNINQAPDGISKLMLVVAKQAADSGQTEVASFASFLGTQNANNRSIGIISGTVDLSLTNANILELMYAPRAGEVFAKEDGVTPVGSSDLIVGDQEDDLSNPGKFQYDLSWTAGENAATDVVGYTVRYKKSGGDDIWHTYVNGKSQDFQGTQANPVLTVTNLEDGTYDFQVIPIERTIPALKNGTAAHVTLQGGSGNDAVVGLRLVSLLPGELTDDRYTDPLVQNNPNFGLPLGFIFNPTPYNSEVDLPNRFATYLDGGYGNDILNGDFVNDHSGDDYVFQGVTFKGLNTLVGGQGSDTFVVKNGGNAIGDEFDWVVKYGNETPVVTQAGNIGSSLNGGQHNLVVSRVDFLTLSDELVNQGKFIDQLALAEVGQFGQGNRLDNYIYDEGEANTLVGDKGRDSIVGAGELNFLIGGTAYGVDQVGLAVKDFASVVDGGNGLKNSIFRDTDPIPVLPNGPGTADPSQFWFVPGYYGGVYDPNRNQDTLVAGDFSDIDGGAGRDSMVGSKSDDQVDPGKGDMFYVSQGIGGNFSQVIGIQDAVFGNGGNDTVTFTDSDYLWWSGHLESSQLLKNGYIIANDISNLILQAGSPSARNATGNHSSEGNYGQGSNIIQGNEFDNSLNGGGVGGILGLGTGVDILIGGSGKDNFVVSGYTASDTNEWAPSIIDYTEGPLAGKSVWIRIDSVYTDADYVVVDDFEAGDNLQLAGNASNYWIGAAPLGDGIPSSFVDNIPLLSYLQTPSTTRFGIYTSGTPNLVAIVNLVGGLSLDTLSLELAFDPAPSNTVDTNSPFRNVLGWGTFWKLEGSSFADHVIYDSGDYVQEDSFASLTTLVRSGDDTFIGGVLADFYNGYGGNDSLLGGANNDTFLGGSGNDTLLGESGDDSLLGQDGADYIDGGTGTDQMIGGTGDDTFVVDTLTDTVSEQSNQGTDLVLASVSGYTLTNNVENLTLIGAAINGTGNALDNRLTGNSLDNTLTGLAGKDTLDGGAGTDTLNGGADDDTYIVDNTNDTIEDTAGTDIVRTSASFDLSDTKVAGGIGIEHLLFTGTTTGVSLTGNFNANSITGAAGSDTLDGKEGNDTLTGGAGDDFYIYTSSLASGNDRIIDTDGTDAILTATDFDLAATSLNTSVLGLSNIENLQLTSATGASLLGNALNNLITGNDGNDTLEGRASSGTLSGDTLSGGDGDDLYIVDSTTDFISDSSGTDTVRTSVSFNLSNTLVGGGTAIEHLTFTLSTGSTLTGNAGANSIRGGSGNGADLMIGGLGNDTYFVGENDVVQEESLNGGVDSVYASADFVLGDFIENLVLEGSASIHGTGNGISNTIIGNSGANSIDGAGGIDSLVGGSGNDTYFIDDIGDVIVETPAVDIDTVIAKFNGYALGDNLEHLVLASGVAGVISGSGNDGANSLTGNSFSNNIFGGEGNDTLTGSRTSGSGEIDTLRGGAGADVFVLGDVNNIYYTAAAGDDYALIQDFNTAEDRLQIKGVDTDYSVGAIDIDGYQSITVTATSELIAKVKTQAADAITLNTMSVAAV
jgi:Ca2+-binding RTX toxin-like protein